VRALELRAVIGAPLPGSRPRRALVLDSRRVGDPGSADVATLEGFAALLGVVARRLPPPPPPLGDGWVGTSPAYRALLEQVAGVAGSRLPVLITGESGTGKEGVARRIHAAGERAHGPFVALNCAALPESLLEGELFGAVRGAYTGADRDRDGLFRAANGGTLFLDEVGDMPPSMQVKLLRVLQEGTIRPVGSVDERPVEVRVLAATHRNLRGAAQAGTFRADLLYRLAVLEITVPPLRRRLGDLEALVPCLLQRLSATAGVPSCSASPRALRALASHPWPGNVRELESVLARAALRSRGGVLEPEHLELGGKEEAEEPSLPSRAGEPLEHAMVRIALEEARGSTTAAAARIGWTRQKLHRRMLALGIGPGAP
jgi:DNA-binding NtrC family response regulator